MVWGLGGGGAEQAVEAEILYREELGLVPGGGTVRTSANCAAVPGLPLPLPLMKSRVSGFFRGREGAGVCKVYQPRR